MSQRASQRAITVRLDREDHDLLSGEADRLGVKAGTLARMLIRAALRGGSSLLGERQALAGLDVRRRGDEIRRLAARHGARKVRLFGSVARGDAAPGSDVDLLVEMEPGRSLLDLIALSEELEELLGRKVDVLTDGGVNPHLRERIYTEAVPL